MPKVDLTKRGFLQAITAGAAIGTIAPIATEGGPKQLFAIETDRALSHEQIKQIQKSWDEATEGFNCKAILLYGGLKLKKLE